MATIPGLADAFPRKKEQKPSFMEAVYFLFWDKGISYEEFNELPIPYIMGILKTKMYYDEKEKEELEKSKKKNGKY